MNKQFWTFFVTASAILAMFATAAFAEGQNSTGSVGCDHIADASSKPDTQVQPAAAPSGAPAAPANGEAAK